MSIPLQSLRSTLTPLLGKSIEGQEIEVEARFGTFSGETFRSGVTLNTFTRLRALGLKYDPRYAYIHSRDEIFKEENENTRERYTTYFDGDGLPTSSHRLTKNRIQNFDLPDLFVRIAVSTEIMDNNSKPEGQPFLIREKKRWSFSINIPNIKGRYKLDLTEVTSIPQDNPREARTVYEAELEIEPPKIEGLDKFELVIKAILRTVLGTRILYTTADKYELITQINIYTGSRFNNPTRISGSILNQARDLKAKDLVVGGMVPSTDHGINYTVSIKADGVRKLLVIDTTGIYLVSTPADINKIFEPNVVPRIETWIGTVVEGELIPKESLTENASPEILGAEIYFLMYDCLSLSGDFRIRQRPHKDRLSRLKPLVTIFSQLKKFRLELKTFEPFQTIPEFYTAVNKTLDQPWPFKNDGLIFTPNNYQYDTELFKTPLDARGLKKYPDLLKWKPERMWTIDFRIVHVSSPEGNYIDLYMDGDNGPEPFRGSEFHSFDPAVNVNRTDLLSGSPTGTIGEFHWLPEVDDVPGQLQLVRIREDKENPNVARVALDVWKDMHEPVTEDIMRGRAFGLMFRYHNRIKWDIYRQVGASLPALDDVNPVRVLLDIGSGWGQDVAKMVANGFTHVICVEPDQNNRIELQKRLANTELEFRIVPANGQDVEVIVQAVRDFSPTQTVDAISYMLSLSFFFGSEESTQSIYHLVNATLNYGGYFFAFTIDGRYVIDFFNEPANAVLENETYRSNFSMIDFELRSPNQNHAFNYVYVNIPGTIVEKQEEDLTNIPTLFELLSSTPELQMQLISEGQANEEPFMTVEEQVFTQLYGWFIMKRVES